MKKLLLAVFLLVALFLVSAAQPTGIGLHKSQIVYYPFNIEKHKTVDSTDLIILYQHKYYDQDIKEGSVRVDDVMTLQIGKSISKFHSRNLHLLDRRKTFSEDIAVKFRQNYIGYEVFTNKANASFTVINREPFEVEKALVYEEPISSIQWSMENEADTILGYPCKKATAQVLGRNWTVWFTYEIPSSSGPWKLQGLPGLILKAVDAENLFEFSATEIRKAKEPICRYKWQEKNISKQEWLKYEQGIHQQPYIYLSKGGQVEIFNVYTKETLTDSWSIPYNPIEQQ